MEDVLRSRKDSWVLSPSSAKHWEADDQCEIAKGDPKVELESFPQFGMCRFATALEIFTLIIVNSEEKFLSFFNCV